MALIKNSPDTPTTRWAWKSGFVRDDLAMLRERARSGDLDAKARLKMLDSLEVQSNKESGSQSP